MFELADATLTISCVSECSLLDGVLCSRLRFVLCNYVLFLLSFFFCAQKHLWASPKLWLLASLSHFYLGSMSTLFIISNVKKIYAVVK